MNSNPSNINDTELNDFIVNYTRVNDQNNDSHDISIPVNEYHDLNSIDTGAITRYKFQHNALHINIHSLPAKFEKLQELIVSFNEAGIKLDYILICETFLRENNSHLYNIKGYNFIHRSRKLLNGGGVCMYRNAVTYHTKCVTTSQYRKESLNQSL